MPVGHSGRQPPPTGRVLRPAAASARFGALSNVSGRPRCRLNQDMAQPMTTSADSALSSATMPRRQHGRESQLAKNHSREVAAKGHLVAKGQVDAVLRHQASA